MSPRCRAAKTAHAVSADAAHHSPAQGLLAHAGPLLDGKMCLDERQDSSLPAIPAVWFADGPQLGFSQNPLPFCWHHGICRAGGSSQEPFQERNKAKLWLEPHAESSACEACG